MCDVLIRPQANFLWFSQSLYKNSRAVPWTSFVIFCTLEYKIIYRVWHELWCTAHGSLCKTVTSVHPTPYTSHLTFKSYWSLYRTNNLIIKNMNHFTVSLLNQLSGYDIWTCHAWFLLQWVRCVYMPQLSFKPKKFKYLGALIGSQSSSMWPQGNTAYWQVCTNKTQVMPLISTKFDACMSSSWLLGNIQWLVHARAQSEFLTLQNWSQSAKGDSPDGKHQSSGIFGGWAWGWWPHTGKEVFVTKSEEAKAREAYLRQNGKCLKDLRTGSWNMLPLFQPGALRMLLAQLDTQIRYHCHTRNKTDRWRDYRKEEPYCIV
jgi:hypothetical protein